eukprot:TRINITY_DN50073_c0_g1_i1.p1 TRINITY_DN50073_c0_g1~~TRINITY_DN50073_c0_g1_i1.p1  ORF type:complete len:109 (-),score=5.00 TRINITY_DN50073_c0_g1_i1:38-364(-)
MFSFCGNARNMSIWPNLPQKWNLVRCLQLVLKLFGCIVYLSNLVILNLNPLHYMLITQVPYRLQEILFINAPNILRLTATEAYDEKLITLRHFTSDLQVEDILTKVFP